MREVGKFLSFLNKKSKPRYIHWITSDLITDHGQTEIWEGKVNEIKRHLDNSELKLIEKIDRLEIKFAEEVKNQSEELRWSETKIREELRDLKVDIMNILD